MHVAARRLCTLICACTAQAASNAASRLCSACAFVAHAAEVCHHLQLAAASMFSARVSNAANVCFIAAHSRQQSLNSASCASCSVCERQDAARALD